jgi:hypothetical protein
MALRAGERERRGRSELLGLGRILRVGNVDLIHDGGGCGPVRTGARASLGASDVCAGARAMGDQSQAVSLVEVEVEMLVMIDRRAETQQKSYRKRLL